MILTTSGDLLHPYFADGRDELDACARKFSVI